MLSATLRPSPLAPPRDDGPENGREPPAAQAAAAEARDSYDKLSPREAASTMRTRADEAMEAARRASQTARPAAEAAEGCLLAANALLEQTTAFLQPGTAKEELGSPCAGRRRPHPPRHPSAGQGRMLRAYPAEARSEQPLPQQPARAARGTNIPALNGFGIQCYKYGWDAVLSYFL